MLIHTLLVLSWLDKNFMMFVDLKLNRDNTGTKDAWIHQMWVHVSKSSPVYWPLWTSPPSPLPPHTHTHPTMSSTSILSLTIDVTVSQWAHHDHRTRAGKCYTSLETSWYLSGESYIRGKFLCYGNHYIWISQMLIRCSDFIKCTTWRPDILVPRMAGDSSSHVLLTNVRLFICRLRVNVRRGHGAGLPEVALRRREEETEEDRQEEHDSTTEGRGLETEVP